MKKNNHKKSDESKKKTTQNTIQERNVLLIGDSMVKNIDYKKLERAARKKTVCHSYSGAKVWGKLKRRLTNIGAKITSTTVQANNHTCWYQRPGTQATRESR